LKLWERNDWKNDYIMFFISTTFLKGGNLERKNDRRELITPTLTPKIGSSKMKVW